MQLTLLILGLVGGFCSGLLGIGGAVLLIPLLSTVPPLIGVGSLTLHEVSGITMVQVLAASATGFLVHRRGGFAHLPTIISVGFPMGLCAFGGALVSGKIDEIWLLATFGLMVLLGCLLLLRPASDEGSKATTYNLHQLRAVGCGGVVGFLSGLVGAGGGFMLIPVMVRILGAPLRIAIGSSLGIVLIGALMGSVGKLMALQVPLDHIWPVIAGSLPAALIGARLSQRISPALLRRILLVLMALILLNTVRELFPGCCPR